MTERWLKCNVFKGMFSDELVVRVWPKDHHTMSFFVPKNRVEGCSSGEGEEGKLRVKVFRKDDITWAVLPTDYQESIPVRDEDLQPV